MKLSLIICTYQRPDALSKLLDSVALQTTKPDEIIIVDGSKDDLTGEMLAKGLIENLQYFRVSEKDRGLTKQRNFGIEKTDFDTEIVAFLDDDVILTPDYFEHILGAFQQNACAAGVGGVAINENRWKPSTLRKSTLKKYVFEGYEIKESSRFYLRNLLGLNPKENPSIMPNFSHGRTYSYPLNGKTYKVDLLLGMAMSFRRDVFTHIKFSSFFIGYGLYEDADFSIRAQKYGANLICTKAQLIHNHAPQGRPDYYKYGKMVIRNGWYVWRVKFPNPTFKSKLKWHATAFVLTLVRLSNSITSKSKGDAFLESVGRIVGWWSLLIKKPNIL